MIDGPILSYNDNAMTPTTLMERRTVHVSMLGLTKAIDKQDVLKTVERVEIVK